MPCLKSDSKTDLPCLELFDKKEKRYDPCGFRIRAARVISIRLQRKVAEVGKKKLFN